MASTLLEQYEDIGKIVRVPWSGCWIWTGATTKKGYGLITRGGENMYIHRLSYEENKGPIPAGLQILHTCDVKCCANPDHIYAGTHRDNVFDAISRNRYHKEIVVSHCHRGHEFTPENTYNYNNHRHCKACWKLKYKNKGE